MKSPPTPCACARVAGFHFSYSLRSYLKNRRDGEIGNDILKTDTFSPIIIIFSFKNKQDLFLFNIASILHNLYGYEIFLEAKFLEFAKYKIYTKHSKFIRRKTKLENGINIENFLNHIADAQKVDRDIWNKIYDEFFKEN